jgi:FkbM family methyltransferase
VLRLRRDDLIIDIGMHVGQDTAYYLAKGFNVVAVEANQALVEAASSVFRTQVDSGRLTIVHAAIAEHSGWARLAVSDERTIWSSLSGDFILRNENYAGTEYHYVDVPARTFADVLTEFGVPYYLKVDIEGFDMLCVRALREFPDRPRFVSVESSVSLADAPANAAFDELAELWTLGYRDFKYVNQSCNASLQLPHPPREGEYVDFDFDGDSSGPFGEESPGKWKSIRQALLLGQMLRLHQDVGGFGGRWSGTVPGRAYRRVRRRLNRPVGWYDLHARLPS